MAFALAVIVGLRLAGPSVIERFSTAFVDAEERDASAQSRLDMWGHCIDVMIDHPLFGAGPNHWPLLAPEYGFPKGKSAHSLWFQLGAELGIPGFLLITGLYGFGMVLLWSFMRSTIACDPWLKDAARMCIAAILGFSVTASFVSLYGLELPYYVLLLGASAMVVGERQETAGYGMQSVPVEGCGAEQSGLPRSVAATHC
jgi:O-antigen ligase